MNYRSIFLGCLLAAILSLPAFAQRVAEGAPEGKVFVYRDDGTMKREMEIFFPKDHKPAAEKVPGIILFHGGGWGGGSRSAFRYQCDYFARRGLVAATVTYRLVTKEDRARVAKPDKSPKRLCIPDAKSAIRHISLIATSTPGLNHPDDPEGFDTSVAALVLFNPALTAGDAKDPEIDFAQQLRADAPPAIAFFGSKDKWLKGWNPVYERWAAMDGTKVVLEIAEGQNHAFFNRQPWADSTLISADRFLADLGFLEGEPTLTTPKEARLVPRP